MTITYRGEKFSGYNKPKRTPGHKTKSHAVLAKSGDKVKLIRFGQKGVSGAGKKQDAKSKARRKSFKARHAKNIAKGKMSAAYWANKTKWQRMCNCKILCCACKLHCNTWSDNALQQKTNEDSKNGTTT